VHGEYTGFTNCPDYSGKVTVVKGSELKIGVPNMSPYQFLEFLPDMSGVQVRELQRILERLHAEMKAGKGPFDLDEVISKVEADDGVHKNLQQALVGWLNDLQFLGVFDHSDNPNWERAVGSGRVLVVDLSDMTSLRKKQMLVAYAARRLFNARKRNRVPPFVFCLEEAHQFCPSGESKESAISRSVLETIAREGRKFYASLMLVSQRPVRLSTTVLSQANTNIILRITNPYDLEHIKQSSEAITGEVADMISSLPVGEALIVGEAVSHPIFVKVRQRRSLEPAHGSGLEEAALEFEKRSSKRSEDAKAFM
jgi:DNA helicase HerA-like ATPase